MSKRMLINGRHLEQVRVAIIDDKRRLDGYRVAVAEAGVQRGNIYRGIVANIEPSLDAAFINYGSERHGFLTRHDVVEAAFHRRPSGGGGGGRGPAIDQVLQKGQPLLVQVTRDVSGNKGATLTTNVSLAGRYLVLKPYETTPGVSRKVEDEDVRRKLREKIKNLVAGDFGFIVRTNAVDQTKTELKADLDRLKRLWKQILAECEVGSGPRPLYDDQDLIIQVLRDHLDPEVEEILVDEDGLYERVDRYLSAVMPRRKVEVTLYRDRLPLFSRYNLEPQVEAIYRRSVSLPSGGSLVIDDTEALTAIDVNSGRSTSGESQGETALKTNLEAADEVARQLRMRDIGGLVVVDFIDMRGNKNQRAVERAMRDALKSDRARARAGRLSSNGLLEINRQRVGQELKLRTHVVCPSCGGVGRLLNPELAGLGLLRRIEARAATGRVEKLVISLHPEAAERLQNRRRAELAGLERLYRFVIEVQGRAELAPAEEKLEWKTRESPADGVPAAEASRPARGGNGGGGVARGKEPSGGNGAEGGSSKGRSRRRRRKSKGSDGPQTAAVTAETALMAGPEEAEEEARGKQSNGGNGSEGGSSKSRSRRRRRRKRKSSGGGQDQGQRQAQGQGQGQQPVGGARRAGGDSGQAGDAPRSGREQGQGQQPVGDARRAGGDSGQAGDAPRSGREQGGEPDQGQSRSSRRRRRRRSRSPGRTPSGDEARTEGGPDRKPEPKPEAKPQSKPEAKPEPKPEAKPEPKPEAKPEPKSADAGEKKAKAPKKAASKKAPKKAASKKAPKKAASKKAPKKAASKKASKKAKAPKKVASKKAPKKASKKKAASKKAASSEGTSSPDKAKMAATPAPSGPDKGD